MKQASTLFLKVVVLFLVFPVLAICIFVVPEIGELAEKLLPRFPAIEFVVVGILDVSALFYYFGLYQAFRLLQYIDSNRAFSNLTVQALKKIKFCAFGISVWHTLLLPLFYLFAEVDDAPGVIFVGLLVPFASFVIAVFAAVLQKLLQEAVAIKSENDLTV